MTAPDRESVHDTTLDTCMTTHSQEQQVGHPVNLWCTQAVADLIERAPHVLLLFHKPVVLHQVLFEIAAPTKVARCPQTHEAWKPSIE